MKAEKQVPGNGLPPVTFEEFKSPTQEEWHEAAVSALKGAPFDRKMYTRTHEGITLNPIYTREDTEALLREDMLPGFSPYIRGENVSGYIDEPWDIAQGAECVLPSDVAAVIHRELEKGSTVVSFDLDACTRQAKDPCEEKFKGDYRGLSLANLEDIKEALDGVDLAKVPLNVYAGASAIPFLALIGARVRDSKTWDDAKEYSGCIGADPLGELAETGEIPAPVEKLYDEMALVVKWAEEHMPKLKTILVRGEPYHNGGANAVQETAYVISAAITYIRELAERGVAPEVTAKHLRFTFSLGANFFMEIARLRAAKVVWAKVAESFGLPEELRKMDILAKTSSFTATVYDPYVNILRNTSQAFSGVVGGVNSMRVNCFDQAIRPGGEVSRRIARNIQIMLQTEFDLVSPVDPAGGSWYVESLTAEVAKEVWKLIQETESDGGLCKQIESGKVQDAITEVLNNRFARLAKRSDRAVGTNMYPNTLEKPLENEAKSAEELYAIRAASVKEYAKNVDEAAKKAALDELKGVFDDKGIGTVCLAGKSILAGASMAEVREVLNGGAEPVKAKPVGTHRWTEQFEALRKRTDDFKARTGGNVKVFLANMGPIPQHKARADFSTGFLEVANFEVLKNDGFKTPEEAVEAAKESGADVAVICSRDDTYPELVPPVASGIKKACPNMKVFLAGAPAAEYKDSYVEAGVDDFIHVRANCYDILKAIQDAKEGM